MPSKKTLRDLTTDELRWLLMERRRLDHRERMEKFQKSGRILKVSGVYEEERSQTLLDQAIVYTPPSTLRRFADLFLILVEVAAVIGLVWILFKGIRIVGQLNREVTELLAPASPSVTTILDPTATSSPTSTPEAVVLPSGHTPPDVSGEASFNDAEISTEQHAQQQAVDKIPAPTLGPEYAIRILIPAIGVDAPILQGDSWVQLKKGVGQHIGSSIPGRPGNVVLSAHNDIYGEIFRHLDRLKPGDTVVLLTNLGSYSYLVVNTQIVRPSRVDVMDPTIDPTVTLISCYPYLLDTKRIIVTARLLE